MSASGKKDLGTACAEPMMSPGVNAARVPALCTTNRCRSLHHQDTLMYQIRSSHRLQQRVTRPKLTLMTDVAGARGLRRKSDGTIRFCVPNRQHRRPFPAPSLHCITCIIPVRLALAFRDLTARGVALLN